MQKSVLIAIQVTLVAVPMFVQGQTTSPSRWKAVEDAMRRAGTVQPDGVYKVSIPRRDLKVTADGVEIKPALALGGWLAFDAGADKPSIVMGDLVLTEDEVTPVMKKLEAGGIEITALHNHLQHETPVVMYMHVHGHGDTQKLATTLHDALALTSAPAGGPTAAAAPPELGFDTKEVDAALHAQGKNNGGVYQVSVPRAEKITDAGQVVPNSMGISTAINLQSLGGGKAATTGDFVLIASEVNPVIRTLNENGIAVTALHSHMLNESPRLFFMHFWGKGDAVALARGLGKALEQTNSKR
jgi:hypothetical protein